MMSAKSSTKGLQVIYSCDECSNSVTETDGLWVVGKDNKSICKPCYKIWRKNERI